VFRHENWLGAFENPLACDAEILLAPKILAHLLDEDIEPFFATVKNALKPDGMLAIVTRNDESLDQFLAISPATGDAFHMEQRLRSFGPASLHGLLVAHGFRVESVLQCQADEAGFAHLAAPIDSLATKSHLHFGNGDTIVMIARRTPPIEGHAGDTVDANRARAWLADIRTTSHSIGPTASQAWKWTDERVADFWSRIDGTPLDDLSFGKQSGNVLLAAVEPWLVPGGRHLDLGAGQGHVARMMAQAGYPVAVLEPSSTRLATLARQLERQDGYLGGFDYGELKTIEPFDVVLASEVIEHVLDGSIAGFFDTIRKILRPSGRLVLSTPNREDLQRSIIFCPVTGATFHRWQHVRSFDRNGLQDLLHQHGFQCDVVHEVDFAAITHGDSPFFEAALATLTPTTIGAGSTLLAIAHRTCEDARSSVISLPGRRRFPTLHAYSRLSAQETPPDSIVGVHPHASITRRLVLRGYSLALPIARGVLPPAIKKRLARFAPRTETLLAPITQVAFDSRPACLADFKPLLAPDTFARGPVLLVNNALAWGGAERQVVYTLLGLERMLDRNIGLICMKLGFEPDYDFYKRGLTGFRGIVRNAIALRDARRLLSACLTSESLAGVMAAIAWMPADVQEDILRFTADFLDLKPAVVHVWQDALSLSAGYAARIVGVPKIIVSARNMAPVNFAYYRPYMAHAYREIAACDDIVMLNNSEAGAHSYANWLEVLAQRFRVLRNGIDPTTIVRPTREKVDALRLELAIPTDAPVIGSIFRFYEEKRPVLWIEAAGEIHRTVPEAHFVVFGTGPMMAEILSFANERGISDRLRLPGTIADPGLALGLFDVFLLTSKFEGTPNVVLEAGLMGVPIVATDAGGTAEALHDGITGYVVPGADAQALAARVTSILADPLWREAARSAGPAFVLERFGLMRMLTETITMYRLKS
jgi:glycosyltransferase involved in cell wall biosynthesis/2-polyprenyl-3-methyl-5-hydroxy-6-metoxy-1,4-benzoquinol methylase